MDKSLLSSRLGGSVAAINDGSKLENVLPSAMSAIGHLELLIKSCPFF
jgi:hypothetical protein